MTAAVQITGLRKNYGHHTALHGIDLTVPTGSVVGFIGPNGAGKTTTMRILLDILRPTGGDVRVLGEDPRAGGARLRARVGYLPGELRLEGRSDVAALLDHYVAVSSTSSSDHSRRHRRDWRPIADRLGLDPTRKVRTLSKGNKQKVGLVQAFVHSPELLVLDEPTSGLDPLVQAEFLAMVREAQAAGQTVFLSSHVLSEVEQVAESVVVLREGRIVASAPTTELRADAGTRVRLHLAGDVSVSEFATLAGVRSVNTPAPRPGDAPGTHLLIDLLGPPDALIKAAARHTVLDIDAERPDLEDVVMRPYRDDPAESTGNSTPAGGAR